MGRRRAAVGPEDFKKLLERHGLNLIVERVEDEKTVVQLSRYGVDFAQGFLFGEPRAVREDTARPQVDARAGGAIPQSRLRRLAVGHAIRWAMSAAPTDRFWPFRNRGRS